jgi:cytochrome d ubiquinol oxidase subunit II
VDDPTWRRRWDIAIFAGSALPALLWGVALTNVVMGLPIDAAKEYTGNLFTLLNPVGLLGGLTTVALFLTHGALFIALKTEGDIRHEARALSLRLGAAAAVLAVGLLITINVSTGSVASWAAAVVAAVALLAGLFAASRDREGWAFVGTFLAIGAAVATLFLALFPDVMPSTTSAAFSLTTTNASSTAYTLTIMTWVAAVFTPIVLLYTSWTYWTFRKRVGTQHIPAAV